MRGSKLAVLLLAVALLTGCSSDSDEPALVGFGHSYMGGSPWLARAAGLAGMDRIENRAVGRSVSDQILRRVQGHRFVAGDVVVIQAALNDVRRYGTSGAGRYESNLRAMLAAVPDEIDVVLVADPPVRDWDGRSPFDHGSDTAIALYASAAARVASDQGAGFVDLAPGWDVDRMIGPDGIHPNDTGVEHIAQEVAAALRTRSSAPQPKPGGARRYAHLPGSVST